MANDMTPRQPEGINDDDGFHSPFNSNQLGSNYLKWSATKHWIDRDGLTPPSPLLVFAIDQALRTWKGNKPTIIRDKPLPDIGQLNAAIPQSEWQRGLDGQLRKPYEHIVIVRLVNLSTGEIYKFESATYGAHIAYDKLNEQVFAMRALRGNRCMPIVNPTERPMKTNFGMGMRPHFEIIGWKTPGEDAQAVLAKPTTPQLSNPAAAAENPPASASAATTPAPTPASNVARPRQAKPPVNLSTETLAAMGDIKPVTSGEILNDEIPW